MEGDESQWATAEQQVTGLRASGCLEQGALDLLQRALQWHREHPGHTPQVTVPGQGGTTACFEITSVTDDLGRDAGLSGPVGGGDQLTISGRGIEDPDAVLIGGRPAVVESSGPDGASVIDLEVVIPAAAAPGEATIVVRKGGREATAPQTFTYTAAAGSSGSASSSSTPSGHGEPSTTSQSSTSGAPSSSATGSGG